MKSQYWVRTSFLIVLPLLFGCSHLEKCCGGSKKKGAEAESRSTQGEIDYPSISRNDLSKAMKKGSIVILDANGTDSYNEGHIPGALNFESPDSAWSKNLPEDRSTQMVAYCGGPRCMAWKGAAIQLSSMGYKNVFHYPGGLMEWTDEGMPLEQSK
jgi:rhodanese-related sulfurtransferase